MRHEVLVQDRLPQRLTERRLARFRNVVVRKVAPADTTTTITLDILGDVIETQADLADTLLGLCKRNGDLEFRRV